MTRFSRATILEIVNALRITEHARFEEFIFRYGLEGGDAGGGLRPRSIALAKYLFEAQEDRGPSGKSLIVEIVEDHLEQYAGPVDCFYDPPHPREKFPNLIRCLERDGFVLNELRLQPLTPPELSPAETEDALVDGLRQVGFSTTLGHLEQARAAHTQGDWAAANAQLRTFIESLFDEVHFKVVGSNGSLKSFQRREELSKTVPPFIDPALNEWGPNGIGFIQGFWKRLHPTGSHPGLSDETDATFRLHLCLVVGSYFVRRMLETEHE